VRKEEKRKRPRQAVIAGEEAIGLAEGNLTLSCKRRIVGESQGDASPEEASEE